MTNWMGVICWHVDDHRVVEGLRRSVVVVVVVEVPWARGAGLVKAFG